MKITINNFMKMVAHDNDLTIKKLSDKIGRKNSSLGFSLRDETLRIKDLKKCFDVAKEPLVIPYKGNMYEIEFKTDKK